MKRIICLLLCAGLLCAFCACGGKKETDVPPSTATDVPTDILNVPETPEETAAPVTPVPEDPAAVTRDERTELTVSVGGKTETVQAVLRSGTFAGGPAVSLYAPEGFGWEAPEEGFILTADGGSEQEACALELRFVPDVDADAAAPGLLDGFDDILLMDDEGTVSFAGRAARAVSGKSESLCWQAWIIELPEGVVELVLCTYPQAEAAAARMRAFAETVEIVSNY